VQLLSTMVLSENYVKCQNARKRGRYGDSKVSHVTFSFMLLYVCVLFDVLHVIISRTMVSLTTNWIIYLKGNPKRLFLIVKTKVN
jgi:hypothetical protein